MAANAAAGVGPSSSSAAGRHADLPTDAVAVRNILKTMGVEQHEPRVVNMLLDFVYSYTSGVLSDAAAYAEQVCAHPRTQQLQFVTCCCAVMFN
jgi:transcription initiation factor TFIID subunit 9B